MFEVVIRASTTEPLDAYVTAAKSTIGDRADTPLTIG
jgi:hypothetical protein